MEWVTKDKLPVYLKALLFTALLYFGLSWLTAESASAAGTTYYINNVSGSNADNGMSELTAWADFTNVNNLTLQPGDRVLLVRGGVWNQELRISGAGTSADWIEIGAYGTGDRPRIAGNANTTDRAVRLNNTDYVRISQLEISHVPVGIVAYYTSNGHRGLRIEDCYFHDIYGFKGSQPIQDHTDIPGLYHSASIFISGDVPVTTNEYAIQDITIENCEFDKAGNAVDVAGFNYDPQGQQGFLSTELGTHAARNIVLKNLDVRNALAFFNLGNVEDVKIVSSGFDFSGYDLTNGCGGFFWSVKNVEMTNNTVTNQNYKISGGAFFVDNSGIDFEAYNDSIKVRGSYIADHNGPGIEVLAIATTPGNHQTNHVISGNVFANNGKADNTRYVSGVWLDNHYQVDLTGAIDDNLFAEPTGLIASSGAGDDDFTYSGNLFYADRSDIYHAANDFGIVQGHRDWKYEYLDSGTYYSLNYDSANKRWGNLEGNVSRFDMNTNSDSDIWLSRTWEAPESAVISVRGRALKNDISGGDGVRVRITKNGSVIWPVSGPSQAIAYNDNSGIDTFLDSISVNEGDLIRFEVNNGGNGDKTGDRISWTPAIGMNGAAAASPYHTTIEVSDADGISGLGTNAIDDNETTAWQASDTSYPQWLKYDLGAVYPLNSVSIRFIADTTWEYKIEGSADNATWTTLSDHTGVGVGGSKALDTVSGSYRYVRVTITGATVGPAGITELRINKNIGYATLLSAGKPVIATTSSGASYDGSKAVDGNDATYWCASSGSLPQSLTVDLGDLNYVSNAAIRFITSDVWSYRIEGSIDNSEWVTMIDRTADAVQTGVALERTYGTYRYVRLTVTGSGGNWAAVNEFKIFGSPEARALISQGKPATVSSYSGSNTASQALDGDEDTYWVASNGTKPQWLTVDLGSQMELTGIRTAFYVPDTWQFKVEASTDNANWMLLTNSWDGGVYWANPNFEDAVHGKYRYVRLTVRKGDTHWAAVKEFKVFGIPQELSAGKGAAASSSSSAAFAADKATDGNADTYWCATDGTFPQWLTVDLGTSQALSKATTQFFVNDTWKYKIEGSNDNSSWTLLADRSAVGVAAGQVADNLSGSYRYVRITVVSGAANWAAIREFNLY
ncbi:discoidin domain-containing protein [Cohnella silvisoli]|uniref:Discoidin domain-containing protein n=1 Tax=Cohnella silvisoli TaxID=2873699 RepID=A0ABV1KS25_9BACL|nr:discoidin domain-containing protein [Cohnella silvisoli]MCD9022541.1 discoidin domain-containing protein [Cohnella silvisoli]